MGCGVDAWAARTSLITGVHFFRCLHLFPDLGRKDGELVERLMLHLCPEKFQLLASKARAHCVSGLGCF